MDRSQALEDLVPAALPVGTAAGERLLDAAEELFYRCGIGAVGVDLIAERAGVTKRTLYQRYGSKAALVAAYLHRRAHRWQSMLLERLAQLPAGAAQVEAVFAVAEQWARENPRGCAFINAWAELGSTDHPAVPVIEGEKRWMRALFVALIDHAVIADRVHLLYEGAHVFAGTLGDHRAYRRAAEAAVEAMSGQG